MLLKRSNSFWRNVSPGHALGDLLTVFRQAGPMRWRFALLAAATSVSLFWLFWREETRIPPRLPHITYITVFRPGRTDAEIRQSNWENQRRKERLAAEQAKRDQEVKDIYKAIGRVSGMDVDAIERQAKADETASAAAQAARTGPTANTAKPGK